MRFTKHVVARMTLALMDAAPDDATRAFIRDAVQISNPGDGTTHFAGMAGDRSTEYGGTGARCAVAYLYGVGVEFDLWNKLRDTDRGAYNHCKEAIYAAQNSMGVGKTYSWAKLGREYTRNNFDSWVKSLGREYVRNHA